MQDSNLLSKLTGGKDCSFWRQTRGQLRQLDKGAGIQEGQKILIFSSSILFLRIEVSLGEKAQEEAVCVREGAKHSKNSLLKLSL